MEAILSCYVSWRHHSCSLPCLSGRIYDWYETGCLFSLEQSGYPCATLSLSLWHLPLQLPWFFWGGMATVTARLWHGNWGARCKSWKTALQFSCWKTALQLPCLGRATVIARLCHGNWGGRCKIWKNVSASMFVFGESPKFNCTLWEGPSAIAASMFVFLN